METVFATLPASHIAICLAVAFIAGFVKGVVGFAMPLVLISGMSSVISPELALAGLIFPTVLTNGVQALRQGLSEAWQSIVKFRRYLIVGGVCLTLSAQLINVIPIPVMLLIIGIPVVLFATVQLLGWTVTLKEKSARVETGVAMFAGFLGGLSGIWGPPTVLYLTALNTEKHEQMRVQGVIYGLGACTLVVAHVASGLLSSKTAPFSLSLVAPAMAGLWLGGRLLDRIDQRLFKTLTLAVVLIAGANLIRRALLG